MPHFLRKYRYIFEKILKRENWRKEDNNQMKTGTKRKEIR